VVDEKTRAAVLGPLTILINYVGYAAPNGGVVVMMMCKECRTGVAYFNV
jgi:predicted RNA-binding Zn-ribbon protein involved in translation (DUF1610 family)